MIFGNWLPVPKILDSHISLFGYFLDCPISLLVCFIRQYDSDLDLKKDPETWSDLVEKKVQRKLHAKDIKRQDVIYGKKRFRTVYEIRTVCRTKFERQVAKPSSFELFWIRIDPLDSRMPWFV